ncbi:MAG: hypothetical protein EPN39_05060 [Chitinophagaceae bacterium]|nr:MAG: hypothetical protein EPN39_05060 [Chitinophagaceae bacterium]
MENDYNLLQKYVLAKSGIKVISPGNCKEISWNIEKLLGKIVSETTLKRFFGFANQKYSLSKYTLNTLCEYAGFNGWDSFHQTISVSGDGEKLVAHTLWKDFREKSLQVTEVTQKTLKNSSGLPFPYTISRPTVEADFKYFMESDYKFFCLTGAPGAGKTLQMAHLVDKFFLGKNAPYESSIIWFFKQNTSKELLAYDIDLIKLLEDQFNLGEEFNFLEYFHKAPDKVEGKLVLMVDGLDEYLYERWQLDYIFENIIRLIEYLDGEKWLKIVLSVRTSTWSILRNKFEQNEQLNKIWYSGISYQEELKANMIALNKAEITTVLDSICKETGATLYPCECLYNLFSNPYYISLYYYLLKKDINTKGWGDALFCVLVSSFINKKLRSARDYIEKDHLLRKLVRLCENDSSGCQVEKNKLLHGSEGCLESYYNLINEGFLIEAYDDRNFDPHIYVRFLHDSLYTYFLSLEWMDQDDQLEQVISLTEKIKLYPSGRRREMLTKWFIWHYRLKDPDAFIKLAFSGGLSPNETWALLNFSCDILVNMKVELTAAQKTEMVHKSAAFIASHFMELNCLSKRYEKTVSLLLSYASEEQDKAYLLIIQCIMAMLRLDKKALWKGISELRKINENIFVAYFPIHPVHAFEYLFGYYAMDTANTQVLASIENFIRKPPYTQDKSLPQTGQVLAYQFAIFILSLSRRRMDVIAFVETIQYLHPHLFTRESCSGITIHLLLRKAFACLRSNQETQASEIAIKVEKCLSVEKDLTSHSLLLLELLKGEIAMRKEEYRKAVEHFLYAYEHCRQNEFIMLQIYAALPLLKIYKMKNNFKKVVNIFNEVQKAMQEIYFPIKDILLEGIMA